MAAEQHIRHGFPPKALGPGVVGAFQQAVGPRRVAVLVSAQGIAQRTGQQAGYRIDEDHRGQLAPAEDKIADADLVADQLGAHPFVHPFVAPADQSHTGMLAQFLGHGLVKYAPLGGEKNHRNIGRQRGRRGAFPGGQLGVGRLRGQFPANGLGENRLHGPDDWLRLHHHSAAAAVGRVVADVMAVGGVGPDIVQMNLDELIVQRTPQDALGKNPREHCREEREDVEADLLGYSVVIFGNRGSIHRLLISHFSRTFSLSYIFRLIGALVGFYSRSRRESHQRNAASGGPMLRRIYGHIVAQSFGSEKLSAFFDAPPLARRNLSAMGQIGMASVIVLVAWVYWPESAVAPSRLATVPSAISAPSAIQPGGDSGAAPLSAATQPDTTSPVSQEQISATKERFVALDVQSQPEQSRVEPLPVQAVPLPFGAEIADAPPTKVALPAESAPLAVAEPNAATASSAPSRPSRLTGLLDSLAGVTAGSREAVEQVIADVGELATGALGGNSTPVEAQPTSVPSVPTPVPQPTPAQSVALAPGPQWPDFVPAAAPAVDHFWLGQPHSAGYNQFYSPNYQFGSTANERYRIHHGVDIASDTGTPVLAMGEGEVVHAGADNPALLGPYNNFYGNAVVVRLNRRLPTAEGEQDVYVLLGHMSEVYVERGQQVTPDVVVGAVGMTGIAIGPHLHVEVRVGQNSYLHSVNPALWMQNPPGTGSVAARLLSADGRSWSDARLSLLRYEGGGTRWVRTIEIYPDAENISPDPAWGENGALSQLAAGAYWIGGVVNGEKFGQNITIYPGETTFVELRTQQ